MIKTSHIKLIKNNLLTVLIVIIFSTMILILETEYTFLFWHKKRLSTLDFYSINQLLNRL